MEFPPQGFVKLNFNRSHLHNYAAGGFIIGDWAGSLIKAGAAPHGYTSIVVAEARALCDGLYEAVKAGFKQLVVEGDNTTVIQTIKGIIFMPWKINFIVRDISHYLNQMSHVTLSHNYREANLAADW